MLNFYNVFRKIHPELANRLEELDRKMNLLAQSTNDTLIIRTHSNDFEGNENVFAKGEVIFADSFKPDKPIYLSEEQILWILRDVKVIMVYSDYKCYLMYKNYSHAGMRVARFGSANDGIKLSNNTFVHYHHKNKAVI